MLIKRRHRWSCRYLFLPTAPLTTPAFLSFLLIGCKLLLKLMHAQLTSRHWGGVGMLTFMLTCATCTTDVTSLGRGGVGKLDRRVDRRLLDQIKASMYRHNSGHNLWKELGKLAKKSRR